MADYFKIKKDGDPIYEIFLLERGKKAEEGVKYLNSFDDFEEKEGGVRIYRRNGRDFDSGVKGDYDLMIESVGEADLSSIRFGKESPKSFTIFQIESVKLSHKYEDPRLISSTDILKTKTVRSWSDCSIKDAEGFEALIAGIRREISLGKLGI